MSVKVDATHEEWRPVVGWEGLYEVSSIGRVRSLDRMTNLSRGGQRLARGVTLRSAVAKAGGYPMVNLSRDSSPQVHHVHKLVLNAFVGPRPEGCVACHNDGDPTNNRVENLRWDTYSENNHDLVRHGTHRQTRKTHCARGHAFTPENTRVFPGRRRCKTCEASDAQGRRARKKG